MKRVLNSAFAALVSTACASPAQAQSIRNSALARLEATAILQTLNADLLAHSSATLTLERWCAVHRLSTAGQIRAELVRGIDKPATAEVRHDLGVGDAEPVRFRHVRLWCGERLLSEADNWYLPSTLSPEMNHSLDTSDIPFGRVVKALGFTRRTLNAELLWHPLPDGWEMLPLPASENGYLELPSEILRHRAVLATASGLPFSEVVETYRADLFAFPLPDR